MDKSPDAFRTISEVADWLGVQAHVLRFWESKFTQVKPVKRAGGRRYYRPADMLLIGGIKRLLHDDGLTIKGVQKILREQGVTHVASLSQSLDDLHGLIAIDDANRDAAQNVVPLEGRTEADTDTPDTEPELDFSTADEPDEEPAANKDAAAEEEDANTKKSALPSFLHKPAAEPARPAIVDAPDPPNEADMPYQVAALGRLAEVEALQTGELAEITLLAQQLRAWHDRLIGQSAP